MKSFVPLAPFVSFVVRRRAIDAIVDLYSRAR
jgi:hypothetical protein